MEIKVKVTRQYGITPQVLVIYRTRVKSESEQVNTAHSSTVREFGTDL
jgi:hypothetical protein